MVKYKQYPRCILAVFRALPGSEIEYVFFVSKVVGPYDQHVREAVNYAEHFPSDSSFGWEPQRQDGGTLYYVWRVFCSRGDWLRAEHPARRF